MTGEKSITNCFGKVDKKKIKAFISSTDCEASVDLFCENLGEMDKIYFVEFEKQESTNRDCNVSSKSRQVRGRDLLFIPTAQRIHKISISNRLTVREVCQMYTGVKIVYAINPNLNVP